MKKACYFENLSNTQREKFLLLDEEGKKVRFAKSRNDIKGLQEVYREGSVALAFYSSKQQVGESDYYIPLERISGAAVAAIEKDETLPKNERLLK